jgi:hypothetical protein
VLVFVLLCIDDSEYDSDIYTEKWLQRDIIYTCGWLPNIGTVGNKRT